MEYLLHWGWKKLIEILFKDFQIKYCGISLMHLGTLARKHEEIRKSRQRRGHSNP